jgi:hypothetical protein
LGGWVGWGDGGAEAARGQAAQWRAAPAPCFEFEPRRRVGRSFNPAPAPLLPQDDGEGGYTVTRDFVVAMMEEFRQQRLIHKRFAFQILLEVGLGRGKGARVWAVGTEGVTGA